MYRIKYIITYRVGLKLSRLLTYLVSLFTRKLTLKKIIVIESHNDFDGNGGAFYSWLIDNKINDEYTIVWLLKHKCKKKLPDNVFCYSLWSPSLRKALMISRAKCILYEQSLALKSNGIRKGQIVLYMTHGPFGLKNIHGHINLRDVPTHFLSPSTNMDDTMKYMYSICSPPVEMLHIGYPSFDVLFNAGMSERGKLGLTSYDNKKVITWMPTFRKGGGINRNDSLVEYPRGVPLLVNDDLFCELDSFLQSINCVLIIKLHPMQDLSETIIEDGKNIRVITGKLQKELDIDNYRLLAASDALISDYSSIAFNYLQLDRPLGFMIGDIEDYKLGYSVPNPDFYICGHKIITFDDLKSFIIDVYNQNDVYSERRRELRSYFFSHNDNNNCARLYKWIHEHC